MRSSPFPAPLLGKCCALWKENVLLETTSPSCKLQRLLLFCPLTQFTLFALFALFLHSLYMFRKTSLKGLARLGFALLSESVPLSVQVMLERCRERRGDERDEEDLPQLHCQCFLGEQSVQLHDIMLTGQRRCKT